MKKNGFCGGYGCKLGVLIPEVTSAPGDGDLIVLELPKLYDNLRGAEEFRSFILLFVDNHLKRLPGRPMRKHTRC